jgi:hypothetical protein
VHSYALVIADWRLPDGDSHRGCRCAVGRKNLSDERLSAPNAGWQGRRPRNIMKPIMPIELVDAVRRAIGEPVPPDEPNEKDGE